MVCAVLYSDCSHFVVVCLPVCFAFIDFLALAVLSVHLHVGVRCVRVAVNTCDYGTN